MTRRSLLALILTALLLFAGCSLVKELPLEEKLDILQTVEHYYYDLGMGNYKNALNYILVPSEKKDSSGFELNNKTSALSALSENLGYSVEMESLREEVYDYMENKGLYVVVARIKISYLDQSQSLDETLYLRKFLDDWKIEEIESADPFIPLRSNLYWYYSDPKASSEALSD